MHATTEQGTKTTTRRAKTADASTSTSTIEAASVAVAKPVPTPSESLLAARAANPTRYALVESVVEQGQDGAPKRVVIRCADPQTKQGADGQPMSVCTGTREIAVQDLFQVTACAACADRKVRKARRQRAKRRMSSLKAMLAASK